ncbi:MAG TPA: hypothetical protein ENJ12_08115, partial [Thiolapillus brandeum]|nr:hypothetical protein [Thiolapillus brandeum]
MSDPGSPALKQARRWQAPDLSFEDENPPEMAAETAQPPTAAQLEEVHRLARQEGFQQGLEEGLREGRRQSAEKIVLLDSLLQYLAQPFEQLDDQVEEQLVALALAVA